MQDVENDPQDENQIGGLKIRTEDIAFRREEMVACAKCGKANPPNRASCLYCAAELAIPRGSTSDIRLNLRKLENWENGYNVVFIPPFSDPDLASACQSLKLEQDLLTQMVASKHPFPLARLESASEADIAAEQLARCGLPAKVVSDVSLKIGKPNKRLRRVEFANEAVQFTDFNTGQKQDVPGHDIVLIVMGKIVESKKESVEKGKKEKRKLLSETATFSEDLLIDLYRAETDQGWRITTKGFDFSGLGSEKSLLAVENIQRLLEKLKSFASAAKIINEYPEFMDCLTEVWDIDRRTDFEGLKRTGVLKSGFANTVRTSNLDQFTKYSRLQRLLL